MLMAFQIDKFLRTKDNYLGTFPVDRLPDLPKKFPKSIIINTDQSNKPGDHWIALVLTEVHAFYFDSFGLGIVDQQVRDFLLPRYSNIIFSSLCIQHILSDKCGYFCIYFVKCVNSVKSYYNLLSNFRIDNLKLNDFIVMQKLNILIK